MKLAEMNEPVCGYVWRAARPEVPDTEVNHFCQQAVDHDNDHHCSCGASRERP